MPAPSHLLLPASGHHQTSAMGFKQRFQAGCMIRDCLCRIAADLHPHLDATEHHAHPAAIVARVLLNVEVCQYLKFFTRLLGRLLEQPQIIQLPYKVPFGAGNKSRNEVMRLPFLCGS